MQGKGLIKIFSIALAGICLFHLSFTWFSNQVESAALEAATEEYSAQLEQSNSEASTDSILNLKKDFESSYLDSAANEEVPSFLNLFGYTYNECKEQKINLGLDLQGGLSVTLQVPLVNVIKVLSNNPKDATLADAIALAKEKEKTTEATFVTLFGEAWVEVANGKPLAALFSTKENFETINPNTPNEDVLAYIQKEAEDAVSNTEHILATRIDEFGVTQPNISRAPGSDRIEIELAGVKNANRVKRILQSSAKLEFWDTYDNNGLYQGFFAVNQIISQKEQAKNELEDDSNISNEPIEPSNDESTASTTDNDTSTNLLETFGEDKELASQDSADLNNISNTFFQVFRPFVQSNDAGVTPIPGPIVGTAFISDTAKVMDYLAMKEVIAVFPRDVKFVWSSTDFDDNPNVRALYAIKETGKNGKAPLNGDVITNSRLEYDERGKPGISMSMDAIGTKKWKRMTGEAAKTKASVAILLDEQVVSAPTVQSEITGGRSSITGNFTVKEATDMANILKSGKLKTKPIIIESEEVGASMGAEAISSSLNSLIVGLALVLLFMIFYYNRGGLLSDLSLGINVFFIFGVLASLGATLTLPGMAGLVLTIGMAVDANVIIYERIREEFRNGAEIKMAIANGFKHSYSAIIDANITTILTGIILFIFGSGPIKGFATILLIGILTSFLTAVLLSRIFIEFMASRNKTIDFSTGLSKNVFSNINFNFIKRRKFAYMISSIIIIIGIVSMVTNGFELGVDFNGGRSYTVRFDQNANTDQLREILTEPFGSAPTVKTFGDANQVKITTNFTSTDSLAKIALESGLNLIENTNYEILQSSIVGPTIADDFKRGATRSTILGLILIFAYIVVRFRKWQFGAGAIVAIFHDVLIVLSLFSIFKSILPFSLEIDQAFIAALLTIIGYSINDTVVIFDRIREHLSYGEKKSKKEVINDAINKTLSRTIMTSITTLIVVAILFFFGGEVIRGFAFALLIGIISGTYSSIFIATPTVVDLTKDDYIEKKSSTKTESSSTPAMV